MYILNGKFPAINGNPTTNYAITNEDHAKSEVFHVTHKREMTHESYIGEYEQKL